MYVLLWLVAMAFIALGWAVVAAGWALVGLVAGTTRGIRTFGLVLGVAGRTLLDNPVTPVLALRMTPGLPPAEPAYRCYLFGPVFRDLSAVMRDAASLCATWVLGGEEVPERYAARPGTLQRRMFAPPVDGLLHRLGLGRVEREGHGVGTVVLAWSETLGLIVGALLAVLVLAFASAATFVLVAAAALLLAFAAVLLRWTESGQLWVGGITLQCVACHEHVRRPVYQCPAEGCDALHAALLPGRFGLLRHCCRCGRTLPTLLLTGKHRLQARCDSCAAVLPTGALATRTLHVPIVAGPSAGKTTFMAAAVTCLGSRARTDDPHLQDLVELARPAVEDRDLSSVPATRRQPTVTPGTLRIGRGRRSRLTYLYDFAGEHLYSADELDGWVFLDHVGGVVLVVDPFSLPALRAVVDDDLETRVHPSRVPPDDVLERLVEALRSRGVVASSGHRSPPIAVVLTKGDVLLELTEPGHPYEALNEPVRDRVMRNAAVRAWLERVGGQRHLVASVDRTFQRAGWFVTSAFDAPDPITRRAARSGTDVLQDDPAEVLLWLLRNER